MEDFEKVFAELTKGLQDISDPAVAVSAAELAETASILSEAAQMITFYLSILLGLEPDDEVPSIPQSAIPVIHSITNACEELSDLMHNAVCDCRSDCSDCEPDEED